MTSKLSQNQISELKETWVDPKTVFEPNPDPENSPLGTQKIKSVRKIKSKWKARIEENRK